MSTQAAAPSASGSLAKIDIAASAERYRAQNEFLIVEQFLEPAVLAAMLGEANAVKALQLAFTVRQPRNSMLSK